LELKSAAANGVVPYSGDLKCFSFEIEILEFDQKSEISFGVQGQSP